jgi:hypothetical protein
MVRLTLVRGMSATGMWPWLHVSPTWRCPERASDDLVPGMWGCVPVATDLGLVWVIVVADRIHHRIVILHGSCRHWYREGKDEVRRYGGE